MESLFRWFIWSSKKLTNDNYSKHKIDVFLRTIIELPVESFHQFPVLTAWKNLILASHFGSVKLYIRLNLAVILTGKHQLHVTVTYIKSSIISANFWENATKMFHMIHIQCIQHVILALNYIFMCMNNTQSSGVYYIV